MRTTIRTIAAMSAAILALVSCSKENLIGNGKKNNDGVRVISLSFAQSTKTVLGENGLTPKFVAGDVIKLSDGSKTEECTVEVNEETATITTTLSGTLTAIYPASASTDGQTFTVSTIQSGKFADANICTATIEAGATDAVFTNATAVLRFYVDESIGVKSITVTSSAANIADNSKTITVDPEGEATIDQVTDDPDARICYVAVLPGAATTLTFSSVTTTQDSYENSTVTRTTPSISLGTGNMYNAFIPYYIKVKVSDSPETYQKWGYCNVGAFLPEEAGEYFMWGEVVGHKYVDGKWTNFPTDNPDTDRYTGGWNAESGFADCNTPYHKYVTKIPGSSHVKYSFQDCVSVLEKCDDAAYYNWGGSWRMPTHEEFSALFIGTNTFKADFVDGVLTIIGTSLTFPAAGYGDGTGLSNVGGTCRYWSSSVYEGDQIFAYCCSTDGMSLSYNDFASRNRGYSVRAISE